MTKQKPFKRRVRTRMEKTSESYTTARRQLLAQSQRQAEHQPATDPDVTATGVAENRVSADAVAAKTGQDWDWWFALLDEWGASERKHSEIASWLTGQHGVAGWWAQSITVAYEQARGLRMPGQHRDGTYSVSASRTINVPIETLFQAVEDPEMRSRWLPQSLLEVTTSSPNKSIRGKWDGGAGRVAIGFFPKAEGKSRVALAHEKLTDPEEARNMKAYWAERLADLKQLLES